MAPALEEFDPVCEALTRAVVIGREVFAPILCVELGGGPLHAVRLKLDQLHITVDASFLHNAGFFRRAMGVLPDNLFQIVKQLGQHPEAAMNETRKVLNAARHKMDDVENMRNTNDPEYDEAYAKVVAEEVAEAKADDIAAYKRFDAAKDALIDFEGYQF